MSTFPEKYMEDPDYSKASHLSDGFYARFAREAVRQRTGIEEKGKKGKVIFTDPLDYKRKENLFRWWKDARQVKEAKNYTFLKVKKRLSEKKEVRKNEDLREFLRLGNYYLVKNFFTFGFRTVPKGTYHVIKTTTTSLDIYTTENKLCFEDGYFNENIEYLFEKQTLDAHQTYLFRPGDQYILITTQKCLFFFREVSNNVQDLNSDSMPSSTVENKSNAFKNTMLSSIYQNDMSSNITQNTLLNTQNDISSNITENTVLLNPFENNVLLTTLQQIASNYQTMLSDFENSHGPEMVTPNIETVTYGLDKIAPAPRLETPSFELYQTTPGLKTPIYSPISPS